MSGRCRRQGAEGRRAVVGAGKMGMQARPRPIERALDQPGAHGIEQHVAHRPGQMRLVHRHRANAALPEVTGPLQPRMNSTGVSAMHPGKRAARAVRVGGHEDRMNVVGHQAPGPDLDPGRPALAAEDVAVKGVILVLEKRPLSTIAALRHVMWDTGNDDAGEAGHAGNILPSRGSVK